MGGARPREPDHDDRRLELDLERLGMTARRSPRTAVGPPAARRAGPARCTDPARTARRPASTASTCTASRSSRVGSPNSDSPVSARASSTRPSTSRSTVMVSGVLVQRPLRSVAPRVAEVVDPYVVHRAGPVDRRPVLPTGGRTPSITRETFESIRWRRGVTWSRAPSRGRPAFDSWIEGAVGISMYNVSKYWPESSSSEIGRAEVSSINRNRINRNCVKQPPKLRRGSPGTDSSRVTRNYTRFGAGGGNRTHDLTITSRLRYQLRHTGRCRGQPGAEPHPTVDVLGTDGTARHRGFGPSDRKHLLVHPAGWQAGTQWPNPSEQSRAASGGLRRAWRRIPIVRALIVLVAFVVATSAARGHPPDVRQSTASSVHSTTTPSRPSPEHHDHGPAQPGPGPGRQRLGHHRGRRRRLHPAAAGRLGHAAADERLGPGHDVERLLRGRLSSSRPRPSPPR